MKRILYSWIGLTDLRASEGRTNGALGPIGQAVSTLAFDEVVLLSDHPREILAAYLKWLKTLTSAPVSLARTKLSSPTNFGEIYEHAVKVLESSQTTRKEGQERTFHISPGTPAMAAVWIILSKTRFPATLIESSLEKGVNVVSLPFEISADYIPDLLRKPDEDLERFSQGLPAATPEFDAIIHRCLPMKQLIARARRVAVRSIPVLIMGESGTGKELLARAIHHTSLVGKGPFVAVNCGAIPETLIESELFGYEKGAHSTAKETRQGHIEKAHGGTLFLDEIGELPVTQQVKILRVLQEKEVVPLGARGPRKVDFRLIAATNRDLAGEVRRGVFREDLFYRIAVAVLLIPPVRERKGDLGLLIDALLEEVNRVCLGQPGFERKKLSATARNIMLAQKWPGNVREIYNTIQRVAIWSNGVVIQEQDVRGALLPVHDDCSEKILDLELGEEFRLQNIISHVARHYLDRAMQATHGNKTEAARLLGLPSYQTLTNWLKRYA